MAIEQPKLQMNNGRFIPAIGLGTWQSEAGKVRDAVYHALKVGYRHIDAAFVYGNEGEVGAGIKAAISDKVVTRRDIFVTSKVWCTYHRKVETCLDESLAKLGLDYVDLYLMHWPVAMNPEGNDPLFPKRADGSRDLDLTRTHVQTYHELEDLLKTGKTKSIGVSNYSVKFLQELLPNVHIKPAVDQIENHPLLPQQDIVDFCRSQGIIVEAFSPLGSTGSSLLHDETVLHLASKHQVGAGSVLINYQLSKGHVVLPKSITAERITENLRHVRMDTADIESLDELHRTRGITRYIYPPFGVDLGFPDKANSSL